MKTMSRTVIAVMLLSVWSTGNGDSTVYDGDLDYRGQVYGGQVYDEDNDYRGYQRDNGDLYNGDMDYRGRVYGDDDASVILLDD